MYSWRDFKLQWTAEKAAVKPFTAFALAAFLVPLQALEIETTWRTGDHIPIFVFCNSLEDAEATAFLLSGRAGQDKCLFAENAPFGFARISKWESGPYSDGENVFSVWEISRGDNKAWTLLLDDQGGHYPARPI